MSIRQALIRLSASAMLASLLQLVNGILLARQLGAEGRGEYGELLFWAMTVNGLTNLGIFDSATVRLRNKSLDWRIEAASLEFFTFVAIILNSAVLALLAFGPWATSIGIDPSYIDEFIFYGLTVNMVFMLGTFERARLEFGTLSLERVLTPITYCCLLVALGIFGSDPHLAFCMLIVANVPAFLLRLFRNLRFLSLRFEPASARESFSGAMRFFSVAATILIVGQIDKAIILSLFDDATVGNYFVAFSLVGAAYSLLVTALQTVVLPSMVGISARIRRDRIERFGRLCLSGAFGLMIAVWIAAGPVVATLFGPEFGPAADAARWIAIAMILAPFIGMAESVQMSLGKNRRAIEMHLVVIVVMGLCWVMDLLPTVSALCAAFVVARLLALALGMRHLSAYPLYVRPLRLLWFQSEDWQEMKALVEGVQKRLRWGAH